MFKLSNIHPGALFRQIKYSFTINFIFQTNCPLEPFNDSISCVNDPVSGNARRRSGYCLRITHGASVYTNVYIIRIIFHLSYSITCHVRVCLIAGSTHSSTCTVFIAEVNVTRMIFYFKRPNNIS